MLGSWRTEMLERVRNGREWLTSWRPHAVGASWPWHSGFPLSEKHSYATCQKSQASVRSKLKRPLEAFTGPPEQSRFLLWAVGAPPPDVHPDCLHHTVLQKVVCVWGLSYGAVSSLRAVPLSSYRCISSACHRTWLGKSGLLLTSGRNQLDRSCTCQRL